MSKYYPVDEKERELFRTAMKDVKPLRHRSEQKHPPAQKTSKNKISTQNSPAKPSTQIPKLPAIKIRQNFHEPPTLKLHPELSDASSHTEISFFNVGIQQKERLKFKRAQITIQATLDLHQLNVDQALLRCQQFLDYCQQRGFRNVLIIHGKSQQSSRPILKNILNHWLRDQYAVLAFHSAKPHHGGTGAIYVLLRNII